MGYQFDFSGVFSRFGMIMQGAVTTLLLSLGAIVLGTLLSVFLAVLRREGPRSLRSLVNAYVEVVRNTPLLVQLFLIFFGISFFAIRIKPEIAGLIGMTINLSGYATEIIRAGLEAVPKAQTEAAHSLALTRRQSFQYVILPEALANIWPALTSQFVLTILGSSVCSFIATQELSGMAALINELTFRNLETYLVIAAIYLVITILARLFFTLLGRQLFAWRSDAR